MSKPAVFLDRDGTLLEEAGYLDRLERLVFFPYAVDAVRLLNRAGFAIVIVTNPVPPPSRRNAKVGMGIVIVTNQAGVARGIFKETFVEEAHRHISARLQAGGARIDAFYYCPHHPEAVVEAYRRSCDCRDSSSSKDSAWCTPTRRAPP